MLEQLFAAACFIGLLVFWRLWLEERKAHKRTKDAWNEARLLQFKREDRVQAFKVPTLFEMRQHHHERLARVEAEIDEANKRSNRRIRDNALAPYNENGA